MKFLDNIDYYFKRADIKLKASKNLYDLGNYYDSVSMSYYVMFLVSKALLLKKGIEVKKHQGAIDLFAKEYVNNENFSLDLFKSFVKAKTLREDSDYGFEPEIDENVDLKQIEIIKLLLINGFEIMLNKTIRVSEEVHDSLSALATKNNTFNDVIKKLIDIYEEFSDEQADFYNQEIERIENGIFENVNKITLSELEARVSQLEKEINNEL